MANTYFTRWEYSINQGLISTVGVATVRAAIDIQAEDSGTANHANRAAFAKQVLQSPAHWAEVMAVGVSTQLQAIDPSDEVLDGIIAGIWNAYAGTLE